MDARIDELERLAALHRSGVLTDEEFAAQKARVLGAATGATPVMPARATGPGAAAAPELNTTWQRRFAFFSEHGSPLSPRGAEALRKLPFWTGITIRSNWWAFFFGPIYFFVLGLWKRGLSMLVIAVAATLIGEQLFGEGVGRLVGVAFAVFYSMSANYARYIKVTEGRDEWNPLADLFNNRAPAPVR